MRTTLSYCFLQGRIFVVAAALPNQSIRFQPMVRRSAATRAVDGAEGHYWDGWPAEPVNLTQVEASPWVRAS